MANSEVRNGSVDSLGSGSVQIRGVVKEKENLKVAFLEDFESYWEDIHDRLTVSRMVNDSVIRGIVNAVEQEAADKAAHKESEVAELKERLHIYHLGADGNEALESRLMHNDRIKGSLGMLEKTAGKQFKMLIEEVSQIRGMNPMKRNLEIEILGSDRVQQRTMSEKWMVVDEILNSLKATVDTAFYRMNDIVYLSTDSLSSWQQEHTFRQEMERAVVASFVGSLEEEFEEKLWQRGTEFCSNELLTLAERFKEISILRKELASISKSLSLYENSIPVAYDCLENGEERKQKHRNVSEYHISHSSLWEANGKHEGSVTSTSENFDALRHLSADELINRFRTEMNDMKRDHDYKLQTLTEDYFSLKRDYLNLKERGLFLHVKRDEEFDAVRKKIPDVILKLDKILLENEKLANLADNDFVGTLNSRLDSLQLENRRLKILVSETKQENFHLQQQVSDAKKTILQLTKAEETLSKSIEKLESVVEDSRIDASITETVYECVLSEFMENINCVFEDSNLEYLMVQEVNELMLRDIASRRAFDSEEGFEDSYIQSSITQDLYMVAYRETLRETKEKLSELNMQYVNERNVRGSLEMLVMERENALRLERAEKERLRQDILSLKLWVDEIEMLLQMVEDTFVKETEKVVQASQKLRNLTNTATEQKRTILERNEALRVTQNELVEGLEKIKASESELHGLRRSLELVRETLKETHEEKTRLLAVIQENQEKLSLADLNEMEYRRQIKSLTMFSTELVNGFANLECTVAQNIQKNDTKLKHLCCQLSSLTEEVKALKSAESMYKQLLDRKSSDLQKAEAEVDLLGDEVDVLWDLHEKIYIALDHYSPILKHYPGIIEILKLVRRQLIGESR